MTVFSGGLRGSNVKQSCVECRVLLARPKHGVVDYGTALSGAKKWGKKQPVSAVKDRIASSTREIRARKQDRRSLAQSMQHAAHLHHETLSTCMRKEPDPKHRCTRNVFEESNWREEIAAFDLTATLSFASISRRISRASFHLLPRRAKALRTDCFRKARRQEERFTTRLTDQGTLYETGSIGRPESRTTNRTQKDRKLRTYRRTKEDQHLEYLPFKSVKESNAKITKNMKAGISSLTARRHSTEPNHTSQYSLPWFT